MPASDTAREIPAAIFFFANGLAAVFDREGHQMPRYQGGLHRHAIRRLADDGIDWTNIPEIRGAPIVADPGWWTPDHEARYAAASARPRPAATTTSTPEHPC